MGTSQTDDFVSEADAYALWGERIRLLFSGPPSFLEVGLEQSPFERHSCSVPTRLSHSEPPPAPPNMTADTEAGAPSRPCVSYPDEQLFPFCFYTRLLHSQGANSTVPPAAAAGNTRISTLIQAQHPRVDEGEMEKRLAERLRARTAVESARLKRLRDAAPSKIVSSFCDPKVEKQQALLHSELTAFLLEVRQKNIASLRLRHQLQHSRAVHERLNAGHTFSDPSSWVG